MSVEYQLVSYYIVDTIQKIDCYIKIMFKAVQPLILLSASESYVHEVPY